MLISRACYQVDKPQARLRKILYRYVIVEYTSCVVTEGLIYRKSKSGIT